MALGREHCNATSKLKGSSQESSLIKMAVVSIAAALITTGLTGISGYLNHTKHWFGYGQFIPDEPTKTVDRQFTIPPTP